MTDVGDITQLLRAVARDEPGAQDELLSAVLTDLRRIARRHMRALPDGGTLGPSALINEAYLRLFGRKPIGWDGRRHFFFAATRAMRDLLVEHARRQSARKRGGGQRRLELSMAEEHIAFTAQSVLEVDAALMRLQEHAPRCADVVRFRFFAGLSLEQSAEVLEVSVATVRRDWTYARAWLRRALSTNAEKADFCCAPEESCDG